MTDSRNNLGQHVAGASLGVLGLLEGGCDVGGGWAAAGGGWAVAGAS